ncbi:hypothetical protein MMC28_004876 [Mycoblastus sanguinarius]|nr:hypothetical protein [Mycoblastus sanguinarius]
MGTPFDVAAGLAGLLSLGITAFQGCVQGFILLSTARQLGRDADLLRCMLEWEHYRLYEWSQQAGLASEDANPGLNWNLVVDLLRQLEVQLNDTEKLKEQYGLVMTVTENDRPCDINEIKEKSTLRKLSLRLSSKFYLESSQTIHEKNKDHPFRRLRWVIVDKAKLEGLLQVVRQLIGYLWDILAFQDRRDVRSSLDKVLRNAIAYNNNGSDLYKVSQLALDTNAAVSSAGQLKQSRIELDDERPPKVVLDGSQTRSQKLKALKLWPASLVRIVGSSDNERHIATYDGRPVIVEYKAIEATRPAIRDKISYRVENLAILLYEILDPSFHSLRCLGLIKQITGYVFVFELPKPAIHPSMNINAPECFTLAELQALARPDLNTRLCWALHLAETVLQLHTAGWLHKGIGPHNIIFVIFRGPEQHKTSEHSTRAHAATGRLHIDGPYLANYEYARENSRTAWSETWSRSSRASIYTHRNAQGDEKLAFRTEYDVYALGLVLIEIGMWGNLCSLLHTGLPSTIPSSMGTDGTLTDIHSRLLFSLPRRFADAVLMCLTSKDLNNLVPSGDADFLDDEGEEGKTIDLQQSIVSKLRDCV